MPAAIPAGRREGLGGNLIGGGFNKGGPPNTNADLNTTTNNHHNDNNNNNNNANTTTNNNTNTNTNTKTNNHKIPTTSAPEQSTW